MSIGKHTSLEEARKEKKIDRFSKEHPSTGDEDKFDAILNAMAKKKPSDDGTSDPDTSTC